MTADAKFRHLNLDNAWPHFELTGLVIRQDGALTLAQVPQVEAELLELPALNGLLPGPAGIGVDAAGNLYVADPVNHRIIRIDACDDQSAPLPCLCGPGSGPGQLNTPRGVLVGPRDALYVADSGNHRVQVIDLRTNQVRGIWGQPDPWANPAPFDEPGHLREPWDLTTDREDHIYVLTPRVQSLPGVWHKGRVQKFDADGRVIRSFWDNMQRQPVVPERPTHVTTALSDGKERLFILDRSRGTVLVYQTDGTYDADATARWKDLSLERPAGIIFTGEILYVGDDERGRLLAFDRTGHFLGAAHGYHGALAGLSQDRQGRLLIHPGSGGAVTRLLPKQVYVETGTFLAGPFEAGDQPTCWHCLRVQADPLPTMARLQLFTYTGAEKTPSPPPIPGSPQPEPGGTVLSAQNTWHAAPADALDIMVLNEPGRYLWIGGALYGGGGDSPVLQQIRLEYGREGWMRYLPSIYRRDDGAKNVFLDCTLSLFESLLADEEKRIENLPRLFDPETAPNDDAPHSWLDWLAGWLALELDETWDEARQREVLAEAFSLYGQRGTARGLRRLIQLYTGANVRITEPTCLASVWSLGETSRLGFTTMLAPEHAMDTADGQQPAGTGSSNAPLFEDTAHYFCVQLYAGELACPDVIEKVRQLLDREKPVHTRYDLCVIEPRMRVGFQARVGIDAIVAGPPPDLILGEPRQLGRDTVLAESDDRRATGGTIGQDAYTGQSTTLA